MVGNVYWFVWMSLDMLEIISFVHCVFFERLDLQYLFIPVYYNLALKGHKINLQRNVLYDEIKRCDDGTVSLEHTAQAMSFYVSVSGRPVLTLNLLTPLEVRKSNPVHNVYNIEINLFFEKIISIPETETRGKIFLP